MRLALQIFRKDVERLRWPIALTLALLAYWAFRDATLPWGTDPTMYSSGSDNWMNLAMPFAWVLLIALAVQEDSLVGDRQFWAALPCGWKPLMMAKTMFVAAFVHAPYFVATAIILAARGFNPAAHLPHLFWKQVVLLALTIPAVAAAVVVRKASHFQLLAIAVASAVVLRVRDFNVIYSQTWVWDIRWELALIVAAMGALVVTILQFIRRSTRSSRIAGVLTAIAAACLYSWVSRDATAAISAAFSPAKDHVTVRLAGEGPARPDSPWGRQLTTVSLPLALDGATGRESETDAVSLEVVTAEGARYDVKPAKSLNPAAKDPIGVSIFATGPRGELSEDIYFTSPQLWERVRRGRVTLRGRMIVEFEDAMQDAADRAGEIHCQRNVLSRSTQQIFRAVFECDSVEIGGRSIRNSIRGREPMQEPRYSLSHFPADTWLSPVHRSRAFFAGGDVFDLRPYAPRGFEIIDYTIPNIDLNPFLVRAR